jgi:hypothetical protein
MRDRLLKPAIGSIFNRRLGQKYSGVDNRKMKTLTSLQKPVSDTE